MKLATTTLFALFLLSALTSLLPSTTAQTVFDTDGNPVRNGGTYYIRQYPVCIGSDRGIELARTGTETCPRTVVQSPTPISTGQPIIISSPLRIGVITEGIPLNLTFATPPLCFPTTEGRWTIVRGHPEGQWSVKIDGYEETVPGWFYIKKDETNSFGGYKLVFCPLLTRIDGVCADIGIYTDSDENYRLVLTENNPLGVLFEIATSSSAA